MSLAGDIVDVVFRTIVGVAALTEDDREKAKAAVKGLLDEVSAKDPGPLKARADEVRARHGLIKPTPAQIAIGRGLIARGPLQYGEREAVQAMIDFAEGNA